MVSPRLFTRIGTVLGGGGTALAQLVNKWVNIKNPALPWI